MIGTTLGNFEIHTLLGRGGMGEVYQAKDRKLGRDVAIKVLPEEFAKDADRVARFQREAKLLASLNHPNIASIYGLEESGGTNFLVLELVEGETLADQIKKGPIPVEESLKLALQIAEALEAAHEKGVIHRDLKPANIKVTPNGKVKVLDFGLAKAFAGEQENLNLSNSPTLSNAATQQGVILGTAAYMSPEQAKGKPVDKRADVWAFGCVVYEMLTGRSVFSADDVSQTLARVLERQPDFSSLAQNLHHKIVEMLERCLEKDARNRYNGISDARVDIQKALADPRGVFVQPAAGGKHQTGLRSFLPWAIAALGIIVAGWAVWNLKQAPPPPPVTRFSLEAEGIGTITLSPDGSKYVYTAFKDGVRQLFLRDRDQTEASPIRDTQNAQRPFFSPDGKWIAFFAGNKLKKAPVSGGAAVELCATGDGYGGSWGPDGTIIFASSNAPGLMRVSNSGGEPKALTFPERGFESHRWPEFLPGGKAVLFTLAQAGAKNQLAVLSLETKKYLVRIEGTDGHYAASGHLVFGRGSDSLWAVPFDLGSLELKGELVRMIERVAISAAGGAAHASANDGTYAYVSGPPPSSRKLVWVDRTGSEELLTAPPGDYVYPRISPNGTQAALTFRNSDGNSDIWLWNFDREIPTKLTSGEASEFLSIWTSGGARIAFASNQKKPGAGVYWKAANNTGDDNLIIPSPTGTIWPSSWSEKSKTLFLQEPSPSGDWNISVISLGSNQPKKLLLHEKHNETQPQISPDGRWLAYMSDESGESEVYVRPYPDVNANKWQISACGGTGPLWSRNGRELFYRCGNDYMAVRVDASTTFTVGKPIRLFQGVYSSVVSGWDISLDGKRFLMVKSIALDEAPRRLNIVLNFFEELRRLAPRK